MTEPAPIYEIPGAVLGPEPDPVPELLAKVSALTTQVARYRHALRVIAGLAPEPQLNGYEYDTDAMAGYAFVALEQYNDHKTE